MATVLARRGSFRGILIDQCAVFNDTLCILRQWIGTKGPFASLKQKLIKNGLFLPSVSRDRSEMIQISHTWNVNAQEHPGVNSLAAQAASLQSIGGVLMARDGEHERTARSQPCSPQPRAPGAAAPPELRPELGPFPGTRTHVCVHYCVQARVSAATARCWPFTSSPPEAGTGGGP